MTFFINPYIGNFTQQRTPRQELLKIDPNLKLIFFLFVDKFNVVPKIKLPYHGSVELVQFELSKSLFNNLNLKVQTFIRLTDIVRFCFNNK